MADEPTDRKTYTTNVYKTDVEEVSFLGHPHIDNLAMAVVAIGAELWSTRKRLLVLESVIDSENLHEKVERYVPSAEEDARWSAERKEMIERLYGHFTRTDQFEFLSDFDEAWRPK